MWLGAVPWRGRQQLWMPPCSASSKWHLHLPFRCFSSSLSSCLLFAMGMPALSCQSPVLLCSISCAADRCCLVAGTIHLLPLHLTKLQLCFGSMHGVFACVQDQRHVHHLEETTCSPLGASNSMYLSFNPIYYGRSAKVCVAIHQQTGGKRCRSLLHAQQSGTSRQFVTQTAGAAFEGGSLGSCSAPAVRL